MTEAGSRSKPIRLAAAERPKHDATGRGAHAGDRAGEAGSVRDGPGYTRLLPIAFGDHCGGCDARPSRSV
jgi:hypothetical protein